MAMYMPVWVLYWFPLFLPINYVFKFGAISIVLWVCKKVTGINDINNITAIIRSWWATVISEIAGIVIFAVIEMNTGTDFYYENYLAFCLVAFFCVVILNLALNYIFVFRKMGISTKQKIMLAISTVIVTAPYLFLLPSVDLYNDVATLLKKGV